MDRKVCPITTTTITTTATATNTRPCVAGGIFSNNDTLQELSQLRSSLLQLQKLQMQEEEHLHLEEEVEDESSVKERFKRLLVVR